ncbi:hypothetical protein [Paraliomyxa miuraensis]|uniref:hypothetical protein n=1 Tax=Paraliomyxa miuraensis TaxID=376150 RepID=UPI00224D126E|nr:hypothetical protein [Paraliomyxa miuraensis]MCX4240104.1 hypothetical protein [Paraliomyxa miuraensis]
MQPARDEALKVLTHDLVLAVRWYDIPQLESLRRFRALQSAHFARTAPAKSLVISVSNASGELHFDSGSRDLVLALVDDAKTHLLGMAQIVTGEGFGAASVRSVLSGIQLTARPDYPVKVFSDTQSARPWLEDLLRAASRPDLADAIGTTLLPQLEPGRNPAP